MRTLTCILALVLSTAGVRASHLLGGHGNYYCLGNGDHLLQQWLYFDCQAIPPPLSVEMAAYDQGGNQTLYTLQRIYMYQLPFQIDTCLSTPTIHCVIEAYYETVVTLPPSPGGYTLSTQTCCMNFTVANVVNSSSQGFTFYAEIPDPGAGCNSGPQFTGPPLVAVCYLDTIKFDHSAFDANGDSLVYSLCSAMNAPVTPPHTPPPYSAVPYQTPYSGAYPLPASPALQIDSSTGMITGYANGIGCYIAAVCVDEYQGGVLIGSYQRSMILCVMPCTASAQALLPDTIPQCVGVPYQFPNFSTGGNTFFWDFGTGNPADTSTMAFPTFSYSLPGNYLVTLVVNPGTTCADTTTAIVNATNPPAVLMSGLQAAYQTTDPQDTLTGLPPGGTFSGPGITDSIFDPAAAGVGTHTIYYTYTDTHGCGGLDSMTTVVNAPSGIAPVPEQLDLAIVPNPNNGAFTVSARFLEPHHAVLRIMDATGRVIQAQHNLGQHINQQFDLSSVGAGVYIVEVMWSGRAVRERVVVIDQRY